MSAAPTLAREAALRSWLQGVTGEPCADLRPASADASFRRYLRVTVAGESRVVMDAPPPREDCRPFVQVAALLRQAGVHAPQVLAEDLQRGFLLLSDLGTRTYLDVLDDDNADALFADAIDALIRWQRASRADVLPPYDEALLRRELALFPDWYLQRHLGLALSGARRESLEAMFTTLVQACLAQPRVFVHRDYMPRNLMLSDPNPGVLDFQDAVMGPVSYDLASLFRDAFISWEVGRIEAWVARYRERALAAGLPVAAGAAEFQLYLDWMGLQRHLKVLGIFARLHYRDGKAGYLEDCPRFLGYVGETARKYPDFRPLAELLDGLPAGAGEARR